jgi:hypothetical protein
VAALLVDAEGKNMTEPAINKKSLPDLGGPLQLRLRRDKRGSVMKHIAIFMVTALSVVGAAQAQEGIALSQETVLELVEQKELLEEYSFRHELGMMESALGNATSAVLVSLHHLSESDRRDAVEKYHRYVAEFEKFGTQTSSRWPDELLEESRHLIEDDWRAYKRRSLSLLEAGPAPGRYTAKIERRVRELWGLLIKLNNHLDTVRAELIA